MQELFFLILSVPSHIGASLFFAKPRFNKFITAIIWLAYGIFFLMLKPNMPPINFFISFGINLVLFLITTTGRIVEKGFLFFSYAATYTCFSSLYNMVDHSVENIAGEIVIAVLLMAFMQFILYAVLLPSFQKVAAYIHTGWAKFYGVVVSFWALIVGQSMFSMMLPMSFEQIIVFLLTMVAFGVTYCAMFSSMKDLVELTQEKQKTLHTELLQSQVDAQAKEAEIVRQNRHDMRFHYQTLLSMASNGETERIIDYVKRQSESIEAMSTGRFCEHETINNTLNVYYQKATAQNISMEIRAAAKPDISVPSPALVSVVANILENALHGAVESKAESPCIRVSVKHKSGHLVISCENTCARSLHFEEMPEHLQGIGIHSVISTVEKYNGSSRFSAADGVFRCVIIMDT